MPNPQQSLTVWFITDDKPGHQSQLKGLEKSLAARLTLKACWLPAGLFASRKLLKKDQQPDWIVGAGHRTHKSVLYYAKRCSAFSVILMKPSLPIRWFDAVVCPVHDNVRPRTNVLNTYGVLNKIGSEKQSEDRTKYSILLGGPSKHFEWDELSIINKINAISSRDEQQCWQVLDSRRTPESTKVKLKAELPDNMAYRNCNSKNCPDLTTLLLESEKVWVTQDSVSMIFEALTAGARVGVIDLIPNTASSRVYRSVSDLIDRKWVVSFSSWAQDNLYPEPVLLDEADRSAEWLLAQYDRKRESGHV